MTLRYRQTMAITLWLLIWLLVADVAINFAFDPQRPWSAKLQGLTRYFNYGRSIEGKLSDAVGPMADKANPIVHAGWIDPEQWRALPARAAGDANLLIAVYGQSFAGMAAETMQQADGHMTLRVIGAPAAPLSHSFAAYRADAALRKADVVVVGVLASSLAKSGSISALSWTFESPAPYTFPRFSLQDGKLTEMAPLIRTENEFRRAFRARGAAWQDFKRQLILYDEGYDRLAFDQSVLDRSALARLMRRGWVANSQHYGLKDTAAGIDTAQIQVAVELLRKLREMTSASGERLIVMLLHDRGSGQSLHEALGASLEKLSISHVSTHNLFSSRDSANFVADGHFSEPANKLLAQALLQTVRAGGPPGSGGPR